LAKKTDCLPLLVNVRRGRPPSGTKPGGPPHFHVTSADNVLALCSYAVPAVCEAVRTATGKLTTAATCRDTTCYPAALA
jgi:hypothetical protein